MAHGVRSDCQKKLQDIVDHLHSAPHAAALEKRDLARQWADKDKKHPWIRTLQTTDPTVLKSLVQMAVDVYNDSKLLTPSAWSWPSRSLYMLVEEFPCANAQHIIY